MDLLLTFLEGVVTFVSPCMLPMVPLYLAFCVGESGRADTRRALMGSLGFVCGFTLVFVAMGAFAGIVGSVIARWRAALDLACGAVMVILGLSYLGFVRIPMLERLAGPRVRREQAGLIGPIAFGIAFAVGWTPCVGTFLSAALGLAASSASAASGMCLLLCYSAGLGVPFVLCAALVDQASLALDWVRAHHGAVVRASGWLLVAAGVLMASGRLGALLTIVG